MPTVAATAIGLGASSLLNRPDDSAQKAQTRQNQRAQEFIEESASQAATAGEKLFGSAQENVLTGNRAALGLINQSIPQQAQAMQMGNFGAQRQISQGLPQIQNALMGNPVDYNAFQPQMLNPNMNFSAQMPEFKTPQQALALTAPEMLQIFAAKEKERREEEEQKRLEQERVKQQQQRPYPGWGGGGRTEGGGTPGGGRSSGGGRAGTGGNRGPGPGGTI